jgi:hypothetical protein
MQSDIFNKFLEAISDIGSTYSSDMYFSPVKILNWWRDIPVASRSQVIQEITEIRGIRFSDPAAVVNRIVSESRETEELVYTDASLWEATDFCNEKSVLTVVYL